MRPALAIAFALAACAPAAGIAGSPSVAQNRCSLQIIVVLADSPSVRPATALVISLARAARVKLGFVRDAGTSSFLYHLSAVGDAASCLRGLERLRGDPRVRSADIDSRRQAHADAANGAQ
jgi:hypothetical protein